MLGFSSGAVSAPPKEKSETFGLGFDDPSACVVSRGASCFAATGGVSFTTGALGTIGFFFFFAFATLSGMNLVGFPTIFGSSSFSTATGSAGLPSPLSSPSLSSPLGNVGTGVRLNAASELVFRLTPGLGAFCPVFFGGGSRLLKPLNAPAVLARLGAGSCASCWPGSGRI